MDIGSMSTIRNTGRLLLAHSPSDSIQQPGSGVELHPASYTALAGRLLSSKGIIIMPMLPSPANCEPSRGRRSNCGEESMYEA